MGNSKLNLSDAKRALLAQRLKGLKSKKQQAAGIGKRPFPQTPLSFSQERFWFLQQLEPDSGVYNMHEAFVVNGLLDLSVLEQAMGQVIARHEMLRASFRDENGRAVQTIAPKVEFALAVTDLTETIWEVQHSQALAFATAEAKRPFDLTTAPLLRLSALKLADDCHWLLLTIHHIIADEWSINLIWQELSEAYAALTETRAADLPQLPIQYPDFAHWQIKQFNSGKLDKQLAFWQEKLAGQLPLLQLPTDHPRPADQTFNGSFELIQLDLSLKYKLTQLAQAHGASLFMVLMAAYKLLLYRYTQQTDILVGTPIANRDRAETKELVGLFLNTVVMRSQLDPDASFVSLLKDVRLTALDAYANQKYPFEKLVEQLQPNRNRSHNPLFQTMFVFQSAGENGRSLPNLTFERIHVDGDVSKFDTTLFMMEQPDGIDAAIEYSSDLFAPETMRRMLTHWETLLHSIVENPDASLHSLNILPAYEWQQVVMEWNDTAVPYPADQPIHQLFETLAQTQGEKTAVATETTSLTYAQLNEKANQLAHHLIEQGVQSNDIVGLMVERSIEMAIGILAILKAGGAYLPLDPSYPEERLAFMLEDANVRFTISDLRLTRRSVAPSDIVNQTTIVNRQSKIVNLNGDFGQYSTANPQLTAKPDDLAYVIYTSGSTGKPKGVLVTHQNIVHSTTARFAFYEEPVDKFLLLSSFSFDSSMVGIFWSLCQGGTLCLPNQGDEKDVQRINELITHFGISHLLALPSLYNLLLEETITDTLTSLNTVIVAGEACPKALVETHYGTLPNAKLYNEYGPTEGTVWSTACLIPESVESINVPIGEPIPNMQNLILDPHQTPVPIGVPGELYIGGEGVTRGYLNRPDLTDLRFTILDLRLQREAVASQVTHNNPIQTNRQSSIVNRKFYRTGDLVRWLPDGKIEFLGRIDHQVKIRGFRIELGEIETAVETLPQITEAIVLAVGETQKQLVGYFTATEAGQETAVRTHLATHLPDYMVPSHLIQLDEMPRTPNGKVDRNGLPKPTVGVKERPYTPPSTGTEKTLVTIWQTVLELEQVSVEDNFFNLGGHSLLATRLNARISSQMGVKMPIQTIFSAPTVRQMATVIEEKKQNAAATSNGIQPIKRSARRVKKR